MAAYAAACLSRHHFFMAFGKLYFFVTLSTPEDACHGRWWGAHAIEEVENYFNPFIYGFPQSESPILSPNPL